MERKNAPDSLILENAPKWAAVRIKENKVPLTASLIFGILAYMFAFTNKLVNHDDVFSLFSKGATVDFGRWGLGALDSILPNYSMPWLYGILTIGLIAVSICIIIRIFAIRSKLLQVLLAGTIMVFPSLMGLFAYMFTSSSYAVSFLLAVLAVWFIQKEKKVYALPAMACMILSLSIYQSYVAIAASLLVLILIRQLLHEDKVLPVIRRGFYFVGFLIVSLGIYYAATQVILRLKGVVFSSYVSDSLTFSIASLLESIALAYSSFWLSLTQGFHSLIPTAFSLKIHWLCFGAAAVLLLLWAMQQRGKNWGRFLLLAALIAILPLAINCMYMITSTDSIHTLVLYSFFAIYVFLAVVADALLETPMAQKAPELLRRLALNAVTLALAVIILVNTYVANESYLYLYLNYENAYTFYSTLVADIKMMPEFDENTKLAIIGEATLPEYYELQFADTRSITGLCGFTINCYSQSRFLEYYLGFSIPSASQEEIDAISASAEFEQMAVYPYYGSMQMFGDILVVKLS